MMRFTMSAVLAAALSAVALAGEAAQEPPTKDDTQPAIPPGVLGDWYRTSLLATIKDGVIRLDALQKEDLVAVFNWNRPLVDVRLTADFRVEPAGIGSRAVGLIFGSTDSATYHAVEIDRTTVVLYRVMPGKPRLELARRGGFDRPDGPWYSARVECNGPMIKVFFQGRQLYTVNSRDLRPGVVGAYARQARVEVRRLVADGRPTRLARPWAVYQEEKGEPEEKAKAEEKGKPDEKADDE
jgi:hypothetical protein